MGYYFSRMSTRYLVLGSAGGKAPDDLTKALMKVKHEEFVVALSMIRRD